MDTSLSIKTVNDVIDDEIDEEINQNDRFIEHRGEQVPAVRSTAGSHLATPYPPLYVRLFCLFWVGNQILS